MVKKDLLQRLAEMGIQPQKSLGQNFLISEAAVGKIVNSVPSDVKGRLIEIGPGPGALTEVILARGQVPTLIELDRNVCSYWRGRGLEVIEQDALTLDFDEFGAEAYLVSNLPYQISSSLVIEVSISSEAFYGMTLMFQKEVAQRILAKPRTSEYGLLSVIAQLFWNIKKIADLSPQAFFPAPKVSSRVLEFRRNSLILTRRERQDLLVFLKCCFRQKRKTLLNNFKSSLGVAKTEGLKEWIEKNSFDGNLRPEELAPEHYLNLFGSMKELS